MAQMQLVSLTLGSGVLGVFGIEVWCVCISLLTVPSLIEYCYVGTGMLFPMYCSKVYIVQCWPCILYTTRVAENVKIKRPEKKRRTKNNHWKSYEFVVLSVKHFNVQIFSPMFLSLRENVVTRTWASPPVWALSAHWKLFAISASSLLARANCFLKGWQLNITAENSSAYHS